MGKSIALAMLCVLFLVGTGPLASDYDSGPYQAQAAREVEVLAPAFTGCDGAGWDACEHCGRDAYIETGHFDMNHDCTSDLIDAAMMNIAYLDQDLSGDLVIDADNVVNAQDIYVAYLALNSGPDVIPGCTPCPDELTRQCSGKIRLSFSDDPNVDVDQISNPTAILGQIYVVAEGCENLAGYTFELVASSPSLILDGNDELRFGVIYPTTGSGPRIIHSAQYVITGNLADPYAINIVPHSDPAGNYGLLWATADPPRDFEFETISHAGINMVPAADDSCQDCNLNYMPDSAESSSTLKFCITGVSDAEPWIWGIQGPGGSSFSYASYGERALPVGDDADDFAMAFVDDINAQTCATIRAELELPGCFTITVPGLQGFQFGVSRAGNPLNWMGTGSTLTSASFNPTITLLAQSAVPPASVFDVRCYPNPFNPTTQISYDLPREGHLTISIFSMRGELVKTLIDGPAAAGVGQVAWNGTDSRGAKVAAGVYFYQAAANGATVRGKIALIK